MLQSIYLVSVEEEDYKLLAQENFHIMQVQNAAKILEHSKIIKFLNFKKVDKNKKFLPRYIQIQSFEMCNFHHNQLNMIHLQ